MTGVVLPVALPATTAWQLVDMQELVAITPPAVGGAATLTLAQMPENELWLIDHGVVSCTSATPTEVRLYVDQVQPVGLIDGSRSGNFDVADWPTGLQLRPGQTLLAQWTGASDGALGTLRLQMRVYRR